VVRGETGCCTEGRITRTGSPDQRHRFRVTVKVTNWRAYFIHKVAITCTYRTRI
jgi:hypothetical protein